MYRSGWIISVFFLILPVCTRADTVLREAVECRPREGLPNVLDKLKEGGSVRIAYLGGSITAQPGWRVKTLEWFRQTYPHAQVSEINAAIGGTGSDLGVYRLENDVLRHKPDLLFVEFAVNDGGTAPEQIFRSMEGIVRKTWQADPKTDICFVYTLVEGMCSDLQQGRYPRAAGAMERIADHYRIPTIHMGFEVARLTAQNKVIFTGKQPSTDAEREKLGNRIVFSPDGVHPYVETGHELYLQAVVRSMKRITGKGSKGPHTLKEPFVPDNWENATMVPLQSEMLSEGWEKLNPETHGLARRFSNRMPVLYKADQPGQTIRFRFRGTAAEMYDLLGPDCGQVIVRVDDQDPIVRPRFDAYCTYHRLATLTIARGLKEGIHTVELEIHPDQPDKAAILARRNEKIDDPKRFDDRAWYAGAILVLGEVVD
ncbi:MAG: hypothetical protein JXA82_18885 [Sedimentisphaerales bacterium]|nr:hypothetical protein [Sedimentisphaerales bacterium]